MLLRHYNYSIVTIILLNNVERSRGTGLWEAFGEASHKNAVVIALWEIPVRAQIPRMLIKM